MQARPLTQASSDVERRPAGADDFIDKAKYEEIRSENSAKDADLLKYFGILGFIVLLGVFTYQGRKRMIRNMEDKYIVERPEMKADIGGPWKMTDHNGNPLSDEDLKGKWLIYYFGFCFCPDICPEEMEAISKLISRLKEKKIKNIVPIFVTVDPERDNVEAVRKYVKKFSDDFIGLTGTVDECAKMSHTFRIFYSKGDSDELGNYQVDHSIVSYLFDPNGEYVDFFHKRDSVGKRVEKCIAHMKKFRK